MTKILWFVLTAVLVSASASADADQPAPDMRAVSPKEISAFNAFHQKLFPGAGVMTPEFSATRAYGEKKWTVKASVFTLPEHGYKNLCKLDEFRYVSDARGTWSKDEQHLAHYIWLDAGTDCSKPAKHIRLNLSLPDVDVIDLLAHGGAVLKQASIMLRGNTECSLVHVGGLQLTSLGTGLFRHESMFEFGYAGGGNDRAFLLVRRLGSELTTWDMHCPAS